MRKMGIIILLSIVSFFFLDKWIATQIGHPSFLASLPFKIISFFCIPILFLLFSYTLLIISFYKPKLMLVQRGIFNACFSITLIMLVNGILKIFCGRARPLTYLDTHDFGFSFFSTSWNYFSFPSSHTSCAIAITYLGLRYLPKYRNILYIFAFLGAFSRIALNVHFLSDVLIGGVLGYGLTKASFALNLRFPVIWKFTARSINVIKQSIPPN